MIEKKQHLTADQPEIAVLVAVITGKVSSFEVSEYLDELEFLAETAGVRTIGRFTQRLDKPENRTYVGKGRLEDIRAYVQAHDADMVIFDDDLSPAQARNLENELLVKVLDRSLLILNIFSQRAQTAQSRTQVELAQYQYVYPRLTRMWTHLSKQRGGAGMRGPGEKELETDRRIVKDRISILKEKLSVIDRQNVTRRQGRDKLVRVALVGYTNVGKSTLMNLLAKSDVFAENKLFATVDSTVRKVVLDGIPILLTDTVGFIRKLPTHLIESFKSTLDEVREADILLHVVDISHPQFEEQIEVVNKILADLKVSDKPTLLVFNKTDQYYLHRNDTTALTSGPVGASVEENTFVTLEQLKATYLNRTEKPVVFISAAKKDNIEELREIIYKMVLEKHLAIYPNFLTDRNYLTVIDDEEEELKEEENAE
ncbi:MAG: GTPase HflX [Bacteroidota bacterium]